MSGLSSKTPEVVGEHLSKKIAEQLQSDLDEYLANNPEFPVCLSSIINTLLLTLHQACIRTTTISIVRRRQINGPRSTAPSRILVPSNGQ